MRILIAEDEERARRGLRSVLTSLSEDYEVVAEASNGKQALELLQILKPDVVFTDLKMPFLDGMGLIKAGIAAGACTKYVIVSAYEEFEVARQAISLGVKEYLVKPVTYDELKDTMERLDAAQKGKPQLIDKTLKERYPDVHPLVRKSLGFKKGIPVKSVRKSWLLILEFHRSIFVICLIKTWEKHFLIF